MKRIWYKDGTFKDVPADHAWEYENDPDWDHTEELGSLWPMRVFFGLFVIVLLLLLNPCACADQPISSRATAALRVTFGQPAASADPFAGKDAAKTRPCPDCDGTGYVEEADLQNPGKWVELTCDRCKGTGRIKVAGKAEVKAEGTSYCGCTSPGSCTCDPKQCKCPRCGSKVAQDAPKDAAKPYYVYGVGSWDGYTFWLVTNRDYPTAADSEHYATRALAQAEADRLNGTTTATSAPRNADVRSGSMIRCSDGSLHAIEEWGGLDPWGTPAAYQGPAYYGGNVSTGCGPGGCAPRRGFFRRR